jgi:hypothetical protein
VKLWLNGLFYGELYKKTKVLIGSYCTFWDHSGLPNSRISRSRLPIGSKIHSTETTRAPPHTMETTRASPTVAIQLGLPPQPRSNQESPSLGRTDQPTYQPRSRKDSYDNNKNFSIEPEENSRARKDQVKKNEERR